MDRHFGDDIKNYKGERKMKLLFRVFIALIFIYGKIPAQSSPKFSGLMFGDYFYNTSAHNLSQKDLNGFQFRRIYITTDYTISDNFNTRFRLESDQSNNSLTPGGKLGVMIKDAWLQWKNIFKGSNLIVGISPTPAFDVSEGAWSHRYVEKTILDLLPVIDDLELAHKSIQTAQDIDAVKEGVIIIINKFQQYLKQQGVIEIEAQDQ